MKVVGRILLRFLVIASFALAALIAPQHLAYGAPETRITKFLDATNERIVPLSFPANHIEMRWDGASTATVQLRGASSNGVWQDWQTATVDEDGGATQESGMFIFDSVTELQARVVSGVADGVRVMAIDTENGPKVLHEVTGGATAGAIGGNTPEPDITTRAQWGADESIRVGTPDFSPIQRMDVHHTVTSNSDPDPAATVRAIYAYHVQGNGWNDIGYNFLIDANGTVYEGRYARSYSPGEKPTGEDPSGNGVVGAHTLNHNPGTVGIALLGTFNSAAPTAAQQSALEHMLAWESDRHNIDPLAAGSISGHRDLSQTECPGDVAYALLPTWRAAAATLRTFSFPIGNTPGYWIANSAGGVNNYGTATALGSMAGQHLNAPVVAMAKTPSNHGYWLLGGDGGVFSFGNASFNGSTGNIKLQRPVVGMAPTPSGNGYWFVASDGGVFAYGDAAFYGSTGNIKLNKPVVGMASTPSGHGYWLVASDGGIFAYGDAPFYGSTGDIKLNSPVVTIARASTGGYWLVARDGGVFAFNAPFWGSVPMLGLKSYGGTVQAAATSTGKGYYVLGGDGGIYTFGDAAFHGAGSGGVPAAAIAVLPDAG